MNAEVTSGQLEARPFKPPTVQERAAAVFDAIPSEESLKELAQKSATITTITNDAGHSQCRSARLALKNMRLEIERTGEAGREDAVQTSKAIIAIQKSRTALTKPEEDRLQVIEKAWDDRVAAEKQARIEAEIARVAGIQKRIEELRVMPVHSAGLDSLMLGQVLARADSMTIDPAVFEEFTPNANDALTVTRAALTGLLAKAKERETEAERIRLEREAEAERARLEREELAQLRAAQAERDRLAREAQAKADAEAAERDRLAREAQARADAEARAESERLEEIARQERLAEARAHAEQIRQEREANERAARERQAELDRQKSENDRIAEEQRAAQAAEAGRIKAAREQLERDQAAAAEANKPKPARRIRGVPPKEEMIGVLAAHYKQTPAVVESWLSIQRWNAEAAA